MRKLPIAAAVLVAAALIVAAFAPALTPAQAQDTEIKIALIPVMDTLPFFVAQSEGYFEDAGLSIEGVPVSSPIERDQVMLAGEVDAMLTDLVSPGIFNQDEVQLQVVAQSRRAYDDFPLFRVLAAPGTEISGAADMAGLEIGISENSVIQYITQRIAETAGLTVDDLTLRPEPVIPVRFQLLMEGALPAATLPDPLAQAAIEAGAVIVADDSVLAEQQFAQSVLVFDSGFIADNPDAVQSFVAAWMRAAEAINADPDAYRDLWIENTTVPDSVRDTYTLPPFPVYDITQPLAWDDMMQWMVEADIIDRAPSYDDSVNTTFIDALQPADADMDGDMGADLPGDPANGETLFASTGCIGCHNVDEDVAGTGPSMIGMATRAGETVEGLSATEYLVESIVEPGAHIVEGYQNIMPAYPDLPDSDLNDLVAYLLTFE